MKGFTPFHAKWFRNVINSLVQELWLGRVYLGRGGRNCSLGGGLGVGVCMISFVCILLLKEISW